MRCAAWSVVVLCGAVATGLADDKKEEVVDLDGLKSKAPAEWKSEKPSSTMRLMQFSLTAAKDDKDDAEVQIFKDLGGSAKENVARWKGQFVPPEGKTIDDVAKVTEIEIAGNKATMLDVEGAYKSANFDPKFKGAKKEGFRLIAIHFPTKDHLYHIKLIGPAKTVEQYKRGFDEWLKNFK
jgi:hypothetical protein